MNQNFSIKVKNSSIISEKVTKIFVIIPPIFEKLGKFETNFSMNISLKPRGSKSSYYDPKFNLIKLNSNIEYNHISVESSKIPIKNKTLSILFDELNKLIEENSSFKGIILKGLGEVPKIQYILYQNFSYCDNDILISFPTEIVNYCMTNCDTCLRTNCGLRILITPLSSTYESNKSILKLSPPAFSSYISKILNNDEFVQLFEHFSISDIVSGLGQYSVFLKNLYLCSKDAELMEVENFEINYE